MRWLVLLTACTRPPILLYTGEGTSPGDVAALESLLEEQHLSYTTAGSWRLNRMSDLGQYKLLIVPGGNFVTMGEHATADVHGAVQSGMSYLGICAGAFLAGTRPRRNFNLTGVSFGFYSAEDRGIRKAALPITSPEGTLEQYWEDGPQLSGWGDVVARYPDGTPAVVEGTSGKGWVILSGIHPEAPESWRRGMSFTTPASADRAFAASLVQAALDRAPLPHF